MNAPIKGSSLEPGAHASEISLNDKYTLERGRAFMTGTQALIRLPMLQRELLEVIRKYVNVDVDAVKVDLIKDGDNEVLDISVARPEKAAVATG